MTLTQYGNLYQLTRLIAFNNYFLREDDGLTLIDTNWSGSVNAILTTASEIGSPIKRIIITHAHSDHAADLEALRGQLSNVEVYMSTRSQRLYQGDMTLDADEPQSKLRGQYITGETPATHHVNEGDMVGSLRVIAAPGHTPGHIALIDTRDNTLIAGDAYVTQAGTAVSGEFKLLFPFPAMATWHKPTALATAKKLRALEPSRLAVGHGKVIDNPLLLMDTAIRSAEQKFPKA